MTDAESAEKECDTRPFRLAVMVATRGKRRQTVDVESGLSGAL